MVVAGLFAIALSVLAWLIEQLPDYTPTTNDADVLGSLVAAASAVNNFVNLPALLGVLALWVTIQVAMTLTQAAQWVYAKLPGKMT